MLPTIFPVNVAYLILSQLLPKLTHLSDLLGAHWGPLATCGQSGQFSTFACTYSSSGCELTLVN